MVKKWAVMAYGNRWSTQSHDKKQQQSNNIHLNIQTVCATDGITWGSLQVTEPLDQRVAKTQAHTSQHDTPQHPPATTLHRNEGSSTKGALAHWLTSKNWYKAVTQTYCQVHSIQMVSSCQWSLNYNTAEYQGDLVSRSPLPCLGPTDLRSTTFSTPNF